MSKIRWENVRIIVTAVPTFTIMLLVSYCFNLYNCGLKGGVDLTLRGDLFDPFDPKLQDGARQTYEFWQTDFLAVNGFFPWTIFDHCVQRYRCNHKTKSFRCSAQLHTIAFAQLTCHEISVVVKNFNDLA